MSSNEYATPLTLNIRPSRLAAVVLLLTHVGALFCILLVPLAIFFKIISGIILLLSFLRAQQWVLLKKPKSIRQIVWGVDNDWVLILKDGEKLEANLLPSTYSHTWMTILNFNAKCHRSYSMVLLPDALDHHESRRLRVRLTLAQYSLWE